MLYANVSTLRCSKSSRFEDTIKFNHPAERNNFNVQSLFACRKIVFGDKTDGEQFKAFVRLNTILPVIIKFRSFVTLLYPFFITPHINLLRD